MSFPFRSIYWTQIFWYYFIWSKIFEPQNLDMYLWLVSFLIMDILWYFDFLPYSFQTKMVFLILYLQNVHKRINNYFPCVLINHVFIYILSKLKLWHISLMKYSEQTSSHIYNLTNYNFKKLKTLYFSELWTEKNESGYQFDDDFFSFTRLTHLLKPFREWQKFLIVIIVWKNLWNWFWINCAPY